MATTSKVMGYLPQDTPPFGKMVLLGFQHVLTMFPATVLCALLMHFDVSTVLAVTGFGTIVALIGAKLSMGNYIPLYYGSSFSYIAAVTAVVAVMEPGLGFGVAAKPETIAVVQAGFIATGLINIIVGLIIRLTGGKAGIDKVLPPVITGSVAIVIGIGLGYAALTMASGTCCGVDPATAPAVTLKWWLAAIVTFLAAVVFSVYLQGKGFIGMLPILLAAIVGYLVAIPLGLVNFASIGTTALFTVPQITFPNFADPLTVTVLIGVGIMAIATIPESTAHLYQISLYVDHLAVELKREKLGLSKFIGLNLMLDGLNDLINGIFGSTAGTNYGENNSLMVITRNYSGTVLLTAGAISILLGFIGPLKDAILTLPTAVSGGLSIYLFGVIGMQGIALMMAEKVDLYDPGKLALGAMILIVGIGGNIGYPGGFLPIPLLKGVFPYGWPAIATAAVVGILVNLIFVLIKPPVVRSTEVLE
ncbi:MAG: uracil permease [Chloroflexi bacterium]|nr:MAG: uracil permease [Chloroflexota bacterium]MBA4376409.1 xanthine permease [Anaerolinea sp.]